jgi:hypothetical protein
MPRDKMDIALNVPIALIVLTGAISLVYRHYKYSDADAIAKFLCADFPLVTGRYDRCMKHYKQP